MKGLTVGLRSQLQGVNDGTRGNMGSGGDRDLGPGAEEVRQ
jgi:hypothetical protein